LALKEKHGMIYLNELNEILSILNQEDELDRKNGY